MNLCLFYPGVKKMAHPTLALPVFMCSVNGDRLPSADDTPAVNHLWELRQFLSSRTSLGTLGILILTTVFHDAALIPLLSRDLGT